MSKRIIDTAIKGKVAFEGKVFFFNNSNYLRYDWSSDNTDPGYPKPIEGNWSGWPSDFQQGIDAAVTWDSGKAYFFKGSNYLRYDWTSDNTDPGYPKSIEGNWPGWPLDFQQGIDAAVTWDTGKAYFFKGSNYLRYDLTSDNTDPGYPKPIEAKWTGIIESFSSTQKLGSLSEKYETGGRGPSTVSTGAGDYGGVSYGSYQMTSKPNGGTVAVFILQADFPWRDTFSGLIPGNEAFTEQWKKIATEEPVKLHDAEHTFIKRTHYDPLAAKVRNSYGIDVTNRHYALQEVIWSTAVQQGPNTPVVNRALQSLSQQGKDDPDNTEFDRYLISAIYEERGRRTDDGKLAYFSKNSISVQESVAKRFEEELEIALIMLANV